MICPTKLLVIGGWLRDRIADKTAGLVDTTGILASITDILSSLTILGSTTSHFVLGQIPFAPLQSL